MAWLVCPPLPPLPVGARPQVTIGRSSSCDLALPHTNVSRVHAVVRVLGRQLVLEDRSSFGTWVNGQRTTSRALEQGDVVRIGPYELRVAPAFVDAAGSGDGTRHDATRAIELPDFSESTAMAGRLEHVPAVELLQGLEFHRKDGTLRIQPGAEDEERPAGGAGEGVVVVREGRPVAAWFGALRDDEAVIALARLRRGRFTVLAQAEVEQPTIRRSMTELLLEALRRDDEDEGPPTGAGARPHAPTGEDHPDDAGATGALPAVAPELGP